jgi:hypothetical protein
MGRRTVQVLVGGKMKSKDTLLVVLQSYAPTSDDRMLCADMVWKAEDDGASPREIEIMLAGAISDGLKYGNWPWTNLPNISKLEEE